MQAKQVEVTLEIRRIYDLILPKMENMKKELLYKTLRTTGKTFNNYDDEFDYLINAGIALNIHAISNLLLPLIKPPGKV